MRVAEMHGDEMQSKTDARRDGSAGPPRDGEGLLTIILNLRQSWGFLNGENPDAPRNFYQAVAVQTGHFKIELIPGEFRITSHQGLEVTVRDTSKKFEDLLGNGFLLRHWLPPPENTPSPRSGDSSYFPCHTPFRDAVCLGVSFPSCSASVDSPSDNRSST